MQFLHKVYSAGNKTNVIKMKNNNGKIFKYFWCFNLPDDIIF